MDLYKELGNAIQKNIFGEWEKVTVKIESSLKKMCSFQAEYILSSKETKELKFPVLTVSDLMDWSDTIKVQCQNCRKREEEGQ